MLFTMLVVVLVMVIVVIIMIVIVLLFTVLIMVSMGVAAWRQAVFIAQFANRKTQKTAITHVRKTSIECRGLRIGIADEAIGIRELLSMLLVIVMLVVIVVSQAQSFLNMLLKTLQARLVNGEAVNANIVAFTGKAV